LSGDKSRKKLGYHRTSVACGHCRHRKIRCVPQGNRCESCARLKKECSFHSVGELPQPAPGQKPRIRSLVGPQNESASSSPAIHPEHPSDMQPKQAYPQLSTVSPMQNMGPPSMKPQVLDSHPVDSKGPSSASSARTFDYSHSAVNWMAPDGNPSSARTPADMNPSWRSYTHESPVSQTFSPYTPHGVPPAVPWPIAPLGNETARRQEVVWSGYPPPPTRSMSYGSEHSQSYHSVSQTGTQPLPLRPYESRKPSAAPDAYPPTITTTIPNIENVPGTTMNPHVSLSTGAAQGTTCGHWQDPYAYSKSGEGFGAWYGDG
ncbi:uncharacterized protein BCR38DRAFT_317094, partial [Pseudomassariella vexata]